jgi:hypothetical protein
MHHGLRPDWLTDRRSPALLTTSPRLYCPAGTPRRTGEKGLGVGQMRLAYTPIPSAKVLPVQAPGAGRSVMLPLGRSHAALHRWGAAGSGNRLCPQMQFVYTLIGAAPIRPWRPTPVRGYLRQRPSVSQAHELVLPVVLSYNQTERSQ